jgi:hypothetical protein
VRLRALIFLARGWMMEMAKEFGLNRCPSECGQMMTPDKDKDLVVESKPRLGPAYVDVAARPQGQP